MKTKTNKTPLLLAENDALSYWPITIVPKSKLWLMATAHYGFVPKLSHHSGKTEKTGFYCFSSDDVFSCKQLVMRTWIVREFAPGHRAMTSARKRKALRRQKRGFHGFCKHPKLKSFV